MNMHRFKRLTAAVLTASALFLTACGALPAEYPGIVEEPEEILTGEKFRVNFFYQNNENTYCIRQSGNANKFFKALRDTYAEMHYSALSKDYILEYNNSDEAYRIAEFNPADYEGTPLWETARSSYSVEGDFADNEESFYVMEGKNGINIIPDESRTEGGILSLFMDEVIRADVRGFRAAAEAEGETADAQSAAPTAETAAPAGDGAEDSFFQSEAINVIFTDLSENDITYLGKQMHDYYTADNRYDACVMAIKLEVEKNSMLYFSGKESDKLTAKPSGNTRWYYLVMTGPTTDLAIFVQKLTLQLKEINIPEGIEYGGYELSDLNFTPENFDLENDVAFRSLDASDETLTALAEAEGKDALFENANVRLMPVEDKASIFPVGLYRDETIEFRYDASEKAFGLKGYQGASTKDWALNIDLLKEIESADVIAESTDLGYVFGDPVIYYPEKGKWVEMDPNHQERFFKKVAIDEEDGRHLTIISDNADECGIHTLYITVPVLQRATVSQVVSGDAEADTAWILNDCTIKGTDPKMEVVQTNFFDKFYINLMDMQIEGARDENNNVYEEYRDVYAQVDEVKIVIENIH